MIWAMVRMMGGTGRWIRSWSEKEKSGEWVIRRSLRDRYVRPDEGVISDYFEDEVKLAWLAPFLIFFALSQLMVERSFSPTFSIWWFASSLRMTLKRL